MHQHYRELLLCGLSDGCCDEGHWKDKRTQCFLCLCLYQQRLPSWGAAVKESFAWAACGLSVSQVAAVARLDTRADTSCSGWYPLLVKGKLIASSQRTGRVCLVLQRNRFYCQVMVSWLQISSCLSPGRLTRTTLPSRQILKAQIPPGLAFCT